MSGRNSGIYHGYPDVSQAINVLEVFTDSDWLQTDKRGEASLRASCSMVAACSICQQDSEDREFEFS